MVNRRDNIHILIMNDVFEPPFMHNPNESDKEIDGLNRNVSLWMVKQKPGVFSLVGGKERHLFI